MPRIFDRLFFSSSRLLRPGVGLFQLCYRRPVRDAMQPAHVTFWPEIPTGSDTFEWGPPYDVPVSVLVEAFATASAGEVLRLCGAYREEKPG